MENYNILIIDDEHTKLNALRNALKKFGFNENNIYPQNTVDIRKFSEQIYSFAKDNKHSELYFFIFKYIEDHNISALFVDLNFNRGNISVDKPTSSSGEKLILKLLSNTLHNNLPIIIYTRYAENDLEINEQVSNHVGKEGVLRTGDISRNFTSENIITIFEQQGFTKERLDRRVRGYFENKMFHYNVAVVNALKLEYDAIVKQLDEDRTDVYGSICGKYGYLENLDKGFILKVLVHYTKNGDFGYYGESIIKDTIQNIISNCKPEYITMTGVMGGNSKKVKIGDVVIAKKVFEWDYGRLPTDGDYSTKARPEYSSSNELNKSIDGLIQTERFREELQKYKSVFERNSEDIEIKYGTVATGKSVLNDQKLLIPLQETYPDLLGFEMEISGLYSSAATAGIRYVALKTVVDYGNGNKTKQYQEKGAELSALVWKKIFLDFIY
jgi:nucleoside phosphorylase